MKRTEYLAKLANYEEVLAAQTAKGSTGSTGKLADEVIRRVILAKGMNADCKVGCRKAGTNDVIRTGFGRIEIKTGSGAVAYGEAFTKEDIIEENILPDCDYVAWAPFSKFLTKENMASMTWLFTRAEFIETLEAIGKNGLQSSVKVSKGGAQLNIQTITIKMEERLWDILETMETIEEIFGRA